jgi:hypothetical protein
MDTTYIRLKDMPAAIKKRYGYDLSFHTIRHWRKRHPLTAPARMEELCVWFEARMAEKRGDQMGVKSGRSGAK